MPTNYPGGLDDFAEASPPYLSDPDSSGRTHAHRHADVEAAVEAIEKELGTDPSGSAATVKARLDAMATTPPIHAATHAAGGADPITITIDQVRYLTGYVDALAVGEASVSRAAPLNNMPAGVSGTVYLTFRRAIRTETISQIASRSGTTAAAATPTLCRMGVYEVDEATGNLTLVGSCPNDTAIWSAVNTRYIRTLAAPYTKQAGKLYAYAVLTVTGVGLPTWIGLVDGASGIYGSALLSSPPMFAGVSGQSDLPATIAAASLAAVSPRRPYVEVLP